MTENYNERGVNHVSPKLPRGFHAQASFRLNCGDETPEMATNAAIGFGSAAPCLESEQRSEEPATGPFTNSAKNSQEICHGFTERIASNAAKNGTERFS
jgi:hypothetical protein